MTILWGAWEGGVGSSNAPTAGDGWDCVASVGGECVAILHQGAYPWPFSVTIGRYPNEVYHSLRARKRETAQREAGELIQAELREPSE